MPPHVHRTKRGLATSADAPRARPLRRRTTGYVAGMPGAGVARGCRRPLMRQQKNQPVAAQHLVSSSVSPQITIFRFGVNEERNVPPVLGLEFSP
jgi:hypothetical protein